MCHTECLNYENKYKNQNRLNYKIFMDIKEDIQTKKSIYIDINKETKSILSLIGFKDIYTISHQKRVSKISYAIGKKINLKNKTLKILQQAALLHDLGKIDIPTDILYKPGRLTQEEFKLVKKHPQMSFNILEMLEVDNTVAKIVLQHHERLDGSGYPHGLKSKEIRPAAKILAVADVVEAMLSHRPYKLPLEVKKVVSELKTNRGKLYDKNVVDTCIELLKSGFVLD